MCEPQQNLLRAEVVEDNCIFVLSRTHITMYIIDGSLQIHGYAQNIEKYLAISFVVDRLYDKVLLYSADFKTTFEIDSWLVSWYKLYSLLCDQQSTAK